MTGSKKQQVFYIHGGHTYSSYEEFWKGLVEHDIRDVHNEPSYWWTKTLREVLGDEYEVFSPDMPNKQNAQYKEWKVWFERLVEHLHDGVVLIGWSLGGIFLAKYLSENKMPVKIKSLFLLAAPYEIDELKGRESETSFDYSKENFDNLISQAEKVVIMHSKDDFVVPFEHGEKLAEALPQAEFVVFEDKNHFLIEEFPELVEKIKALT